jgi:hypothetical protein
VAGVQHRLAFAVVIAALALAQAAGAADPAQPQPARPVVVRVGDGGFRWQDAGLGAVAGVATALIVYGLALGARRTSRERTTAVRRREE